MKKYKSKLLAGMSLMVMAHGAQAQSLPNKNIPNNQDISKKNVLFIAIDDLKPLLGCYGNEFMKTPNIDKLASQGVIFTNAHCQQAVSGPSRASLLTGMRPDYTKVWDLKTKMRDINPNIVAMPQYFKENGYTTVATGKIYDYRCVDKQSDAPSWSIPYSESSICTYPEVYGQPALSFYASKESKAIVKKLQDEAKAKGENSWSYAANQHKPSVEYADFPDEAYNDAQICNNAIKYMHKFAKKNDSFFLAVGFKRPHLPFAAPKKYWDLYKRDEVSLAEYPKAVKDGIDMAYHNSGELYSYTDIPELTSFSDIFNDNLPKDKQKELIHGYQACVSFIDAQVGRLMSELQKLGLDKNTVIVLWGDHGWHLGDHGLWCKHTNFEQATRVPLIIKTPDSKNIEYSHPVEFIDIFPSLCELSGINIPKHLQGKSLVLAINNPKVKIKEYAVSQFPRGKKMGYSLRTDRYRLTVWMNENYTTDQEFKKERVVGVELYDYKKDKLETQNLSNRKKYKTIKNQMMAHFESFVKSSNAPNN